MNTREEIIKCIWDEFNDANAAERSAILSALFARISDLDVYGLGVELKIIEMGVRK